MKRSLILSVFAIGLAAAAFFLARGLAPQGDEDQQAWLRREFKLNPAQTAAVEKMQAAYQPVCAEHCRLIIAARDRLAASPNDAPAQQEVARLEDVCQEATLGHLRELAAQMPPNQGSRFLALVEPKVSRHQHQGPLGLK